MGGSRVLRVRELTSGINELIYSIPGKGTGSDAYKVRFRRICTKVEKVYISNDIQSNDCPRTRRHPNEGELPKEMGIQYSAKSPTYCTPEMVKPVDRVIFT
jgi:hypothetical protein